MRERSAGLEYLTRGAELGERGLLITDQKTLDPAIDELVRRGLIFVLNPGARYFHLVAGPEDMIAIVEELRDYATRIDARRLVIDPISSLVKEPYAAWLTQPLFDALQALPIETMIVSALDSTEAEDHGGEERRVEGPGHHQLDVLGDRKLAQ